jgi:hypothetical protein
MKSSLCFGLLSVGVALALQSGNAQAVVATHLIRANAVNYCQAFTPGPANTVRNRVVGSENVGPSVMNVACDFHTVANGAAGATPPTQLYVYFSNNSGADFTVNCSLLTGYQGSSSAYVVTKSVLVPAGAQATNYLQWSAADNPVAGSTNLGNYLLGVNCTLPVGAVINDTYLYWNMDNGV